MGKPMNTPEVLWSKVDKRGEDECWPWLGVMHDTGYGRTEIDGKNYYAHRVIFNLVHPNVIELSAPKDKRTKGFLMHSCDNRICCNPKHLSIGTYLENTRDKISKGRDWYLEGENHPRSVFTNDEIKEILRLHIDEKITAKELAMKFNKKISTIKSLFHRKLRKQ